MLDPRVESHEAHQYILRAWTDRLYDEYDDVLFQFNQYLRKPVIRIEALASDWGHWNPQTRAITLARRLIQDHSWDVVIEVLKHEMAHQLADECLRGHEAGGTAHGASFRQACRLLGVADWAASATGALPQEIPNWRNRVLSVEEERLLKRAEKLLALATSSNEHEAALAVQRVRQLYAKYNLERLAAGIQASHVHCIINWRRRRVETEDSAIVSILTGHFQVRAVFGSLYDAHDLCEYRVVELLGSRENVVMAEYVYRFLRHTLDALWEEYRRRTGRTSSARRSYMLGVLDGFREKLQKSSTVPDEGEPIAGADSLALLKLAGRELDAFVATRYPKLSTRSWGSSRGDRESYGAGISDGGEITLHRGITGPSGNRGLQLPARTKGENRR